MVYWGVSHRYLNPLHIMSHDIVLVTYEILRKELDRVHHHEFTLMLRKRKRSAYPPSPLLAINWWRVCLDEAQTVESITAKVNLCEFVLLIRTCTVSVVFTFIHVVYVLCIIYMYVHVVYYNICTCPV